MTTDVGAPRRGCDTVLASAVLLAAFSVAIPVAAWAQDDPYAFEPTVIGSLDLTMRNDHSYDSEVANKKLSDTYMLGTLRLGAFFTPELSARATITLQPMTVATTTRWFHNEGAFIEELNLRWEPGDAVFFVGKFDPPFGIASKEAPGLYGTEFSGDYLIKEAVGGGATYSLRTDNWGTHSLSAAGFFLDNTPLAQALGSRPKLGDTYAARYGRSHSYYGGVGNTQAPQSAILTVDGGDFPDLPDLRYQIGADMLRHDKTGQRDQYGYVAGLRYLPEIDDGIRFGPTLEFAAVENAGGYQIYAPRSSTAMGQSGRYLTFGLEAHIDNWVMSVVHANRWSLEPADGSGPNGRSSFDQLQTESVGYVFDSGFGITVAHKHVRTLDPVSLTAGVIDTIGAQTTYSLVF